MDEAAWVDFETKMEELQRMIDRLEEIRKGWRPTWIQNAAWSAWDVADGTQR